jgi:hypothetical protein
VKKRRIEDRKKNRISDRNIERKEIRMGQRKKEGQKEQNIKGYGIQKETRRMTERHIRIPSVVSLRFDVCVCLLRFTLES